MPGSSFESYPPPFRPTNSPTRPVYPPDSTEKVPDADPVPVIDVRSLDPNKLREACRDWGLFRLVNHGIPPTLLSQLQYHVNEIFSLPFESKQALFTVPVSYFWGTPAVTPSGVALSRGTQDVDWVEGFNVPLTQLSQFRPEDPMLDSFRALLEEYGRHLTRLSTTIFEALAKTLELDPKQSESYLAESTGLVRVYRYPNCSSSNATHTVGMNEHTDSSVLAILNQDHVGGLQVQKDDKWLHVKPISNTLLVNIGDMMQAMSDDEYKSVKHRVMVSNHEERISVCYFVFPAEDAIIRSSRYKPFTYNDFRAQVQEDVRNLGCKVGLQRFRLTGE